MSLEIGMQYHLPADESFSEITDPSDQGLAPLLRFFQSAMGTDFVLLMC